MSSIAAKVHLNIQLYYNYTTPADLGFRKRRIVGAKFRPLIFTVKKALAIAGALRLENR